MENLVWGEILGITGDPGHSKQAISASARKALYGAGNPGVGIGNFGSELTFAINGLGSNHAVVRDLSIVPSASRQPRRER